MALYKLSKNQLTPIKEVNIDLEKDLQKITEKNLETIFNLKFINSEFALHQFRIDTLAFNNETNSFVIIEYKRDRNFSIIDQGYAYLALMLNNKADFILEYNETMQTNLKRKDIDWTQSKVLFLANSFTVHQQNAINFKDLPIELWEVTKYDNDMIFYNQLKPAESKESIKTISKNKIIEKISREVKKYSIEDHFKKNWNNSKELFEIIRNRILELDTRIEEQSNKYYIGYKIGFYNLCYIHVHKSKLYLHLIRVDKEDLKDPENKVIKISWRAKGWGKLCGYEINKPNDIDYALFLIKQIYTKFYK